MVLYGHVRMLCFAIYYNSELSSNKGAKEFIWEDKIRLYIYNMIQLFCVKPTQNYFWIILFGKGDSFLCNVTHSDV